MIRTHRPATVRRVVAGWRRRGLRIAFVPTMGAIHAGHLSLVERARHDADQIVASIFVNPLQFGPHEDFRRYPRPVRHDRTLLKGAGVDLLWEPRAQEFYRSGHVTRVRVTGLEDVLEGASRPGHFSGVATVVMQLLNVVGPDTLWLGQKDAQQARILEQMVSDLAVPVRVRRGATVRERDGIAMSSRNAYLAPEQRRQATALWRGLRAARERLRAGERSAARLRSAIRAVWRESPLVREDYVAVVDRDRLEPVTRVSGPVLVAVAAWLDRTRLIDNIEWGGPMKRGRR